MQLTISIPDHIYYAIRDGTGRPSLAKKFDLTESQARYYLHAYEESQALTPERILILADLHMPQHHQDALDAVLTFQATRKFDVVILLGDAFCFEAVGSWPKPPTKHRFDEEYHKIFPLFEALTKSLHHIPRKLFISGNHEDWITKYLWKKAPELWGLDCLTVPGLFHLEEFGWEYWPLREHLADHPQDPIKFGDTKFFHGHEFWRSPGPSSINPARLYFNKVSGSCIFGHVHRTSHHPNRVVFPGDAIVHTVGCLQVLNPSYSPLSQWNLGFGDYRWTPTYSMFRNCVIHEGTGKIFNNDYELQ